MTRCSFYLVTIKLKCEVFKKITILAQGIVGVSSLPLFIALDKQNFELKIANIILPISFHICFGCSKEPSH